MPEQTCNVQGRVETMDFCSHLNPFVLNVVSVVAYKPQEDGSFGAFLLCVCKLYLLCRSLSY